MVELLLFSALPRSDAKPLAKRLCDRFGSVGAILAAEPSALAEVKGAGKAVIHALKLAEAISLCTLREQIVERPAIASWKPLLDYCKAKLAHQMNEQFNVLFLDNSNSLIADETRKKARSIMCRSIRAK